MKTNIVEEKGRTIVKIYIPNFDTSGKEEFVKSISAEIEENENGFAGFRDKNILKKHLEWSVFGEDGKPENLKPETGKIFEIAGTALRECVSAAGQAVKNRIDVYVFPTFDRFVKEKMIGVSGFTPWKNTVLIYMNPVLGWEDALGGTVYHEFAHAVMMNFSERKTLMDNLVFEGVAERFRESVAGGDISPWSGSLGYDDATKVFAGLKDKLNSEDEKLIRDVFYGTGDYPLWAGYAVGYHVVGDFLKGAEKKSKKNWDEILRMKPEKFIREHII